MICPCPWRASWGTSVTEESRHLLEDNEASAWSEPDMPSSPSFCGGIPPIKMQQLFPIELLLLPLPLAFKKTWGYQRAKRNCLGSAVAVIALSEPSGRVCIKGGNWGEWGGGWRCPPDKSSRVGSRCLVQPGSNSVPQFRVAWQAPLLDRAVCTRPRTSLLPRLILHCCPVKVCLFFPDPPLPPTHNIVPNDLLPFFKTHSACFLTKLIIKIK